MLLAFGLVVALSACGGTGGVTETPAPVSTPAAVGNSGGAENSAPDADAFVFQTGGVTVSIDENMAGVLDALGEPQSYFEAASCAFDGLDKTYTYSGFIITTRPDGDTDFVNSILLTDDSVTTSEGIYIGCQAEEVTAAYGESESDMDGVLSYTRGSSALNFILNDGAVISIEYLPA